MWWRIYWCHNRSTCTAGWCQRLRARIGYQLRLITHSTSRVTRFPRSLLQWNRRKNIIFCVDIFHSRNYRKKQRKIHKNQKKSKKNAILTNPCLSPSMCKVNNQHQLHQNKQNPSNQPDPHPSHRKSAIVRYEKRSNRNCNHHQIFNTPKAILYRSTSITWRFRSNHHHSHQCKETSERKANTINGQISDGYWTIRYILIGYNVRCLWCGIRTKR